jgi:HEAT repeat protein
MSCKGQRLPSVMNNLKTLVAELTSGVDERAEASVPGLRAHGEDALTVLLPLLTDSCPDTRWWAVRALAEIQIPQVPGLLVSAIEDDDIAVRQCAALALRQQPVPFAVPALIAALGSRDGLLARLAANALIAVGEPAVPELIRIMENGQQHARLEAARALAMIGDQRCIPVLYAALSEESALMDYWANEGLERMGVGMVFYKP